MTDEFDVPPGALRFVQDFAKVLASLPIEPPPPEVFRRALAFRQYWDAVTAAIPDSSIVTGPGELQRPSLTLFELVTVPVPTADELTEADKTVRTQLLETTDQELHNAVSRIADDPEKLKLVAFLKGAIDQATGVRGSSPWVVLVLVFYVCLKINPDPVTSLGTALAVVALMQATKPGG